MALELMYSLKASGKQLGLSHYTVAAWVRSGKLKPTRLGRRVMIGELELERLIKNGQQPLTANSNVAAEGAQSQLKNAA